jgi:tetratricopeptide (TPR) repeat protein
MFQRVSTQEPGVPFFKHDLAAAIICIGNLLSFQEQFAQASASYREGLSIMQDLPRDNIGWQYDLALAYGRLAQADQNLGNVADALAALQKGRDILLELPPDLAQRSAALSRFDAEIAAIEAKGPVKVAN